MCQSTSTPKGIFILRCALGRPLSGVHEPQKSIVKKIGPLPFAREENLATGRTLNLSRMLKGVWTRREPGWDMDLGFLQLHLKEPWSKASGAMPHIPFGSVLPSGVTRKPHQTAQCTWEVHSPVLSSHLHSNTNRGCQNTSCFCGGQKSGDIWWGGGRE